MTDRLPLNAPLTLPGERIDTDSGFVWDTQTLTTFAGADIQIVLVKHGQAYSISVIIEGDGVEVVRLIPHDG